MPIDRRIEQYLTALEMALRPLPVSDRAEIITEIKSHLLAALDRDPSQSVDNLLESMGSPQTVASRYLLEREQPPAKPPVSPIVKWLVIGFLGTLALFLLFVGVLISRFSPLIRIDEKSDRVTLLGGLIDVSGTDVSLSQWKLTGGKNARIHGSKKLAAGQVVSVRFTNGKMELTSSDDDEFHWSCATEHHAPLPSPVESGNELKFDLTSVGSARCELSIPEGRRLRIQGSNGKLAIEEPAFHLDAELTNGKVGLNPDPGRKYRYDLSTRNGRVDPFESSTAAEALQINIRLTNGKITESGGSR